MAALFVVNIPSLLAEFKVGWYPSSSGTCSSAQAFQEIGFLNPIAEEHLHPALGAVGQDW
jgi:hypothetical protein